MSDARVSIEVRGTSVSPTRTCINNATEHSCKYRVFYIFLNIALRFCSLCLSQVLCVFPNFSVFLTLPQVIVYYIFSWMKVFFVLFLCERKFLHGCNLAVTMERTSMFHSHDCNKLWQPLMLPYMIHRLWASATRSYSSLENWATRKFWIVGSYITELNPKTTYVFVTLPFFSSFTMIVQAFGVLNVLPHRFCCFLLEQE